MSNPNKIKGWRLENETKKAFQEAGFEVQRMGQANQPDLFIKDRGFVECKARKTGLKKLYGWLGKCHVLVVRQVSVKEKGLEPLAIVRLSDFIELFRK